MIIASIGTTDFLLKDIKQAEDLMNIINSAQQIDHAYLDPDHTKTYHLAKDKTALTIELKQDQEIISYEEALAKKQKQREAATKEANSER